MKKKWKYVPLAEAVDICDSLRKPINSREREKRNSGKTHSELYPYYGATGQVGYIDDYITDGEYVLLGEDGAPFLDPYASKAYIINGKTWVNNHAHVLKSKTNNKFLCYYLNCFNFKRYVSGTTRLKLTQAEMKRIPVPVPPACEQERIVARIETLLSQLDTGLESLNKSKAQLAVYRQAVLQKVLHFNHKLKIRDCIGEMGQGWSPKCEKENVLDDNEWAVITTTAVQPMAFHFEENKKLPSSLLPREKHILQKGDVLITRAGPRMRCGICCMVRMTKARLLNCDKVYKIRVNHKIILPEYMEVVLNCPEFIRKIELCKTGGNDSGVNLTQERFLNILIPVPSIDEQKKALNEIESRLSVYSSIVNTVNTALQQAETMRQSILKDAFEGASTYEVMD